MGVESYITFQPPVTPPPTVNAQPAVSPPFIEPSLGWLTNWTPPVPPRLLVERPYFSLVVSEDTSFSLFPYTETVFRPVELTHLPFNYGVAQAIVEHAATPSILTIVHIPAAVSCDLNLGELKSRLADMLDDPFTYYTENEMRHALNIAQRLFCLITLCLEKTVSFALTNGQAFYQVSDQISDFLAPLRATHANTGARLKSDTIHNLDLRDVSWRSKAGNPARYAQAGLDLLAVTPQPASGVHTLSLTYAAEPAEMTLDSAVPEVPSEQQIHLLDGAFYLLRLKEGGAELAGAVQYLQRFLAAAGKYASFVRAKSRAQLYDRYPVDLERFDMGRFEIKLKRQASETKKSPTRST